VDDGDLWSSEPGLRHLDRQWQAIARQVRIRRLLLPAGDADDPVKLHRLLEPHLKIRIEVRVLRHDDTPFLFQTGLEDFIIFDQKVTYEVQTARVLSSDVTSSISNVALVSNPQLAAKRRQRFEDLWAAAAEPEKAVEAARRMLRDSSPDR